MNILPRDVVPLILSHLSPEDLMAFRRASRKCLEWSENKALLITKVVRLKPSLKRLPPDSQVFVQDSTEIISANAHLKFTDLKNPAQVRFTKAIFSCLKLAHWDEENSRLGFMNCKEQFVYDVDFTNKTLLDARWHSFKYEKEELYYNNKRVFIYNKSLSEKTETFFAELKKYQGRFAAVHFNEKFIVGINNERITILNRDWKEIGKSEGKIKTLDAHHLIIGNTSHLFEYYRLNDKIAHLCATVLHVALNSSLNILVLGNKSQLRIYDLDKYKYLCTLESDLTVKRVKILPASDSQFYMVIKDKHNSIEYYSSFPPANKLIPIFPCALWQKVFSFLSIQDRKTTALACRKFRNVIHGDPALFVIINKLASSRYLAAPKFIKTGFHLSGTDGQVIGKIFARKASKRSLTLSDLDSGRHLTTIHTTFAIENFSLHMTEKSKLCVACFNSALNEFYIQN